MDRPCIVGDTRAVVAGGVVLGSMLLALAPGERERPQVGGDSTGVAAVAERSTKASPSVRPPTLAPRLSPGFVAAANERAQQVEALRLSSLPEGGYAYEGTRDERFDAVIRPDGVVVFEVDPLVKVEFDAACLLAICVHRGTFKVAKGTGLLNLGMLVAAEVLTGLATPTRGRDPKAGFGMQPQPPPQSIPGPPSSPTVAGFSGKFGYLPPPRGAMSAFLERTFVFRLELARHEDARRCDAQQRALPGRLMAAWMEHAGAPNRRKDAILELWDELQLPVAVPDELRADVLQSLQPSRERAAREARLQILEFVRRQAPAGSADAFSEAELAAINAGRVGEARFEPYAATITASEPGGGGPPRADRARDSGTLPPRSPPG